MKTFVISEIGINHNGNFDLAKEMIYASKEAGVSAVKFQTYTIEERVSDNNKEYRGLFERCMLTYDDQFKLKEYADQIGIEFFSTPFGKQSLDFLINDLCLDRVKLASFDITNTKFLDAVNEHSKRLTTLKVIMSTGMANAYEIQKSLEHLSDVSYLTLLHCVSSYPTPSKESNLEAIRTLRYFVSGTRKIGYSDHTNHILTAAAAVLVGATTIEKHFTLDLNGPGVDNPVSADPRMMSSMIKLIESYEELLGDGDLKMSDIEKATTKFRRVS